MYWLCIALFLLCLLLDVTKAIKCVKNCTCTASEVICAGANYDDVLTYVQKRPFIGSLTIQNTPIGYLERLPKLNLLNLELSHCNITKIEINAFQDLEKLRSLNLNYNSLTEIPKLKIPHKGLHTLSAKFNKIREVSSTLFMKSQIANIDFSYNCLSGIEFLEHTKSSLESLDLSHNSLNYVTLEGFPHLSYVGLAHNGLKIVNLTNLTHPFTLDVSDNRIPYLDVLRLTDSHLRHLNLQKNLLYINDVVFNSPTPLDFMKYAQLQELNMAGLDFTKYDQLQELNLDDNGIFMLPLLPNGIQTLSMNNNRLNYSNIIFPELDLRNVSLSGNRLETLDCDAFTNLRNVTTINLLNNSLTTVLLFVNGVTFDEKQLKVDRTTKLTFKNYGVCPKNCTCSCYEVTCKNINLNNVFSTLSNGSVKKISIRDTPIRHLKKLPKLNVVAIEFSHCEIETIEENAFDNIPTLTNLSLDYNFLTELPKLGKLTSLLRFSARKNMISKVSNQLLSHGVRRIDLSHNLLDNVDFLKPTNATLQTLDLRYNFIRRVEMTNFSELTYLYLENNLLRKENSVELNNLPKLETLLLAENSIEHLNVLKITDTPIKTLGLQTNLLHSELDFTNYTSLTKLDLDYNTLTTLPLMPANLEVLRLGNNQLKSSSVVFPPLKLEQIYLAGNHMERLPYNAFIHLYYLEHVNLPDNNFHDANGLVFPFQQTIVPFGIGSGQDASGWPYSSGGLLG